MRKSIEVRRSRFSRRWVLALFAAVTLWGCASENPTHDAANQNATRLISAALWGDPVFDRDANAIARALKSQSQNPVEAKLISVRSLGIARTIEMLNAAYSQTGEGNSNRLLVSFFSSHGDVNLIGIGDQTNFQAIAASQLRALLAPSENQPHIVIVQACYSGSLIDELAHPNRIIFTAAANDRPSFGCAPDAKNSWFTKALKANIQRGRSWRQVFEATRAQVNAYEASLGIPPEKRSRPQIYVGAKMREIYDQPL